MILAECARFQPDIVYGHFLFPAGFLAVHIARMLGVPSFVAARGNDLDRFVFHAEKFGYIRHALDQATVVTAVTRALVRQVRAISDRDAEHVPNGIDANAIAFRNKALADPPTIGFSGELRRKKGIDLLLEGFRRFQARTNARLLIIGDVRESERPTYETFLRESPRTAVAIVKTGYLDNAARVLEYQSECDLMVYPARQDGMPNSILEAMAQGIPVLATRVGGVTELLDDETGFLIDPNEADRLDEHIDRALASPGRLAEIAIRARARVEREFSSEAEISRISSLLHRAVSNTSLFHTPPRASG